MKKKERSVWSHLTKSQSWVERGMKYWQKKKKTGFSLIEVIIITAILGLLTVGSIFAYQSVTTRGRDAQRKSDLDKIKIALEEYYNDNGCYPSRETLASCGGAQLGPYLSIYPCDPSSGASYLYIPAQNQCSGYRLQAHLETSTDPIISQLGCATSAGCGYDAFYNYGVSSGLTVYTTDPLPQPSSPPGSYGGDYACDSNGTCNAYANPQAAGCPISFAESNCQNVCYNPAYHCLQ